MGSAWRLKGQGGTSRPAGTGSRRESARTEFARDADRRAELHANRAYTIEAKAVAPWLSLVPVGAPLAERIEQAKALRAADLGPYADVPLLSTVDVAKLADTHNGAVLEHVKSGYLKPSCWQPYGDTMRKALFTQEVADAYARKIARGRSRRGRGDTDA